MDIAVIGTGRVGSTLGRRFAELGHRVVFGSREPAGARQTTLLQEVPGGRADTPAEAAAGADVIVLATPWRVTPEVVRSLGDLTGKVVLDTTNPAGIVVAEAPSGVEWLARIAPGARFVKIFNTTGRESMADPGYPQGAADMFFCGDDTGARETARGLAEALGFSAVDCGPLANAALLENLGRLWIQLAIPLGNGRQIAFKLMRR